MSQRNSRSSDGDVEGVLGCVFGIIVLFLSIFAGLTVFVFNGIQAPAFIRLRRLDPSAFWGATIEQNQCTTCQVLNEMEQEICFACGQKLEKIDPTNAVVRATDFIPHPLVFIAGIIWLIFAVAIVVSIGSLIIAWN